MSGIENNAYRPYLPVSLASPRFSRSFSRCALHTISESGTDLYLFLTDVYDVFCSTLSNLQVA